MRLALSGLENQNDTDPAQHSSPGRGRRQFMKRKPDILWVLVLIFGLGVVTTGYTQGLWERPDDSSSMVPISHSQQLQR